MREGPRKSPIKSRWCSSGGTNRRADTAVNASSGLLTHVFCACVCVCVCVFVHTRGSRLANTKVSSGQPRRIPSLDSHRQPQTRLVLSEGVQKGALHKENFKIDRQARQNTYLVLAVHTTNKVARDRHGWVRRLLARIRTPSACIQTQCVASMLSSALTISSGSASHSDATLAILPVEIQQKQRKGNEKQPVASWWT